MISIFFNWIKKNKLTTILFVVIIFLIVKNKITPYHPITSKQFDYYPAPQKLQIGGGGPTQDFYSTESMPAVTNWQDRLVIKESYLSLVVKDVIQAQKQIIEKAQKLGGFMVQSYIDNPNEAASATITIRLPAKKLEKALDDFKKLAVKVVSENLSGTDVTEEYTDIESRLKTLYKTKAKFEEMMEKTTKVPEILEVQRELINLQQQIDTLVGQKKYLEKSAQLSKITIYLSTDELSLPYAPSDSWRPEVVFKEAVRSLVLTLRKIATVLIWSIVYLPILIPIILALYFWKIRKKNKELA